MDEKEKTVTVRQSRIIIENSNSSIIIDDDGITINSKIGCVCNTNDFINALLKDENVQKAINNFTVSNLIAK